MLASKNFLMAAAALALMAAPTGFAQHNARPSPGVPDGSKPFAFSYRSFWPEFGAMRQFKEAGVNISVGNATVTTDGKGNAPLTCVSETRS